MLERMLETVIVGATNPLPGATTEFIAVDGDGAVLAETVRYGGQPGDYLVAPPTSQLLIVRAAGQDPVSIAGVGTPVAVKNALAFVETVKALGGGRVILDPLAGTGGLVITPAGVDVRGLLLNNGNPLP